MNTLDIILLILFIPGIIRGLTKGFLEQAVSLAGIFISVYLAYKFYGKVGEFIGPVLGIADTALAIVSFVLLLIVALVILILLAKLLTKVIEMATLGWLNRVLGLILSIFVTALVLGLLITVFDSLNEKFEIAKDSKLIADSVMYSLLRDFTNVAFPYLKELFEPAAEAISNIKI